MREIKTTDLEEFNRLMDQLSHKAENQERLLQNIERAIKNPDLYVMVAEEPETGKLRGSMLGMLCDDFCDACRPILFIENVVTDEACRRMGIASQMFRAMEEWGRERDVNYAVLCSAMHRLEAHQFYSRIGYSEVKGFKKYL